MLSVFVLLCVVVWLLILLWLVSVYRVMLFVCVWCVMLVGDSNLLEILEW